MKVAVVYVYPIVNQHTYYPLALRFSQSYRMFAAGGSHELHVLFNGGKPSDPQKRPFEEVDYIGHAYNNVGWDIGAYQQAAMEIPCDLLVCLGAPVHFHKPNWLWYMTESYTYNGPALYGCWCYPAPLHVRTTAFWLPPELLNAYPNQIGNSRSSRYDFEHGNNSITRFTQKAGLECLMVTRIGVYPLDQWPDHAPGVEDSVLLDQHTHR